MSNADEFIHVSTLSSTSDPSTPAGATQKSSFSDSPLMINLLNTQQLQGVTLNAGTKRRLDFNDDDSQQSNEQSSNSLENDVQAQAHQSADNPSKKQKAKVFT
ncbi:hypothetical protein OIU77_009850 [Salix suchowensis]|uniref:Uncharacterized protein n=1 Tax=Salix suchowensis TaxID=1278906 RepID=A0ABQ9A6A8_9ROSI|nr:hypothetical protein OIU77_009850 [Salix suchowensis]